MLKSLHVRNLAVLAGGEVELGAGFNVLTGETGAGKSLVVDSLSLLAGARGRRAISSARAPTRSRWPGVFDLPAALGARCSRRRASTSRATSSWCAARSRAKGAQPGLRQRPAGDAAPPAGARAARCCASTASARSSACCRPELQRALARPQRRRGGAAAARAGRRRARRLAPAGRPPRAALGRPAPARRALDLLRFQAREIDEARPVAGEDEALRRDRDALRHREAIVRALAARTRACSRRRRRRSNASPRRGRRSARSRAGRRAAAEALPELAELGTRLAELGRGLGERLAQLETEPGRLDEIEERLARLERLLRQARRRPPPWRCSSGARRSPASSPSSKGTRASRDELEAATPPSAGRLSRAALALSAARAALGARARGAARARARRSGARQGAARGRARADTARREPAHGRRRAGRVRRRRRRPRGLPLPAEPGRADAAAGADRLGRRAGARLARAPARRARRGCRGRPDADLRRGGRRPRRRTGRGARAQAPAAGARRADPGGDPPAAGRELGRRPPPGGEEDPPGAHLRRGRDARPRRPRRRARAHALGRPGHPGLASATPRRCSPAARAGERGGRRADPALARGRSGGAARGDARPWRTCWRFRPSRATGWRSIRATRRGSRRSSASRGASGASPCRWSSPIARRSWPWASPPTIRPSPGPRSRWPAALSVVLPLARPLPASAWRAARSPCAIPAHAGLRALLAGLGHALTATSANPSGEDPYLDPEALAGWLAAAGADAALVDGGRLPGGLPSTLVDYRPGEIRVLRRGRVDVAALELSRGDDC